jgi:sporulation protein YlmC with PRC-barrel domain
MSDVFVRRGARPSARNIDDLGPVISHLALPEGVPVYDRDGKRVGVVDDVLADRAMGIFDGVIVHPLPFATRHLYAHHDQIAALHERGVLLAVDREALRDLPRPGRRAHGEALENPLQAALRKAWDRIAGVR